jgi:hypothetical protein
MLSANHPGLPLRGLPIASASGSTSASAAASLADTETTTVRFTTVKKLFEQIDQISEDILIVTGM